MENPLLSTRLKCPQPRKNYIVRNTLFKKLDDMNGCRLTIIKGTAGSGKTTLMASYIREKALPSVKWIALDKRCSNLFLFWSYIIEALSDFLGASKQDFLAFFNVGIGRDSIDLMLELLINSLTGHEDIYLVLDDFHSIDDDTVLESFSYFVEKACDNLHIVLLSREEPRFYFAGLGMGNSLLLIDEHDLELSKDDALHFLRDTLALRYTQDKLDYMAELAEGWIGGLQLIAGAASGKEENYISRLRLTNRLISDYLTKEIFDRLTPQEQDFLVHTSALAYFCNEVCTALFVDCGFEEMIENLQQKNMLLICLDEQRGLYRYHNILGEYLRLRFNRLSPADKKKTHEIAALAFADMGDDDESLRHLLALGHYSKALKLILKPPQNAGKMAFLSDIPIGAVAHDVDLAFQKFFYHYSNFEYDKCRQIYDMIVVSSNPAARAFEGMKMMISEDKVDFNMQLMSAREVDQLNINNATKALIMIKNATFMNYQSLYAKALEHIEKGFEHAHAAANPYISFFAYSVKTQIYEEMGYFRNAMLLYAQMKDAIDSNKGLSFLYPSFYYIGITGIYLKQFKLDEALYSLNEANKRGSGMSGWYERGYLYNLAEYLYLTGDLAAASELMQKLTAQEVYANPLMLSGLLKYGLKHDCLPNLILEKSIEEYLKGDSCTQIMDSRLFYAQILRRKGDGADALNVLDELLPDARKDGVYLKIAEAALLKLSILMQSGAAKQEIINLFREAIYYACDEGIRLPFYFEAESVLSFDKQYGGELSVLLSEKECVFYSDVLRICGKNAETILTEREAEILSELAAGLSNKEIAERLCISLATVKTHIINIYGKLGVSSRVAAVESGRKAGLIKNE